MAETNPGPKYGQQIFGGPSAMFGGPGTVSIPPGMFADTNTQAWHADTNTASYYAEKR